jgi:Ser-tRNA(Ala) deacylase AlaX
VTWKAFLHRLRYPTNASRVKAWTKGVEIVHTPYQRAQEAVDEVLCVADWTERIDAMHVITNDGGIPLRLVRRAFTRQLRLSLRAHRYADAELIAFLRHRLTWDRRKDNWAGPTPSLAAEAQAFLADL